MEQESIGSSDSRSPGLPVQVHTSLPSVCSLDTAVAPMLHQHPYPPSRPSLWKAEYVPFYPTFFISSTDFTFFYFLSDLLHNILLTSTSTKFSTYTSTSTGIYFGVGHSRAHYLVLNLVGVRSRYSVATAVSY
jgi:hypothetical protein